MDNVWSKSKVQNVLPFRIDADASKSIGIAVNNLGYSRGSAEITIDNLVIEPGIYAVTGAMVRNLYSEERTSYYENNAHFLRIL